MKIFFPQLCRNTIFFKTGLQRLFAFALLITTILPFSSVASDGAPGDFYLEYSVSERSVSIIAASTPYDSSSRAREALIRWFKRGFETILSGAPPLMIEWDTTPEAAAGRAGYDSGMDEAKRYLKKMDPGSKVLRATLIHQGFP